MKNLSDAMTEIERANEHLANVKAYFRDFEIAIPALRPVDAVRYGRIVESLYAARIALDIVHTTIGGASIATFSKE
jgi:hypothetical protein